MKTDIIICINFWDEACWYYYYYLLIWVCFFLHLRNWRLSDIKSPQVFRTLLSILAVLNNVIVWMVSTWQPTSKSSRPFNDPLGTVAKAPITIGIIVTFMFFQFSSNVEVLISLFTSFQFYSEVSRDSKVDNFAGFLWVFFFLVFCWLLWGLVFWPILGHPFHLCHCIVYICYFVMSYLSLPWYDWFLWRCFVLPLGEILFLP